MDGKKSRDPLSELAAVVRAEKQPELDLARLEARLVVEFEAARARGELRPKARTEAARRLAPWLAVAAMLVLGVGLARLFGLGLVRESTSLGEHERAAVVVARALDGETLAVGASVVSGPDQIVRVEHAERAMWELAADSGAHLVDAGSGVLCVELEHGALSAVVTPGRSESFIVRARGTEIAVHGTRFRVQLDERRVVVSVSEGEVEVRPLERSTRARLTAGMSAAFVAGLPEAAALTAPALTAPAAREQSSEPDTATAARGTPAPQPAEAAPGAVAAAPAPPRRGAVAEAPSAASPRNPGAKRRSESARGTASTSNAAAPSEVPAAMADGAIARVTERIQSCFRRHTSGRGPVSIEAATRVSLEVQPNGLILGVSLDPPLAPPVEACVAGELAAVNLGVSEAGYRVEREIRLSP